MNAFFLNYMSALGNPLMHFRPIILKKANHKRHYSATCANVMTPHGFLVEAMFMVSRESELSRAPERGYIKRT